MSMPIEVISNKISLGWWRGKLVDSVLPIDRWETGHFQTYLVNKFIDKTK